MANPVTDLVSATDEILAALKVQWDADAPALVAPDPEPVLVFEALERDLKVHPKDTGKAWARATVRHNPLSKAAALGNHRFRRTGTVFVQVFVPFKDGSAYTVAQRLAMVAQKAYEGRRTESVNFTSVGINEKGVDGSWYAVNCNAAFWWDEFK